MDLLIQELNSLFEQAETDGKSDVTSIAVTNSQRGGSVGVFFSNNSKNSHISRSMVGFRAL